MGGRSIEIECSCQNKRKTFDVNFKTRFGVFLSFAIRCHEELLVPHMDRRLAPHLWGLEVLYAAAVAKTKNESNLNQNIHFCLVEKKPLVSGV